MLRMQPPLTVSLSLAVGGCRRQHRGVSGEGGGGPRKGAQDFQISSHGCSRNHSAGRGSTKLGAKKGPSAPGLSAIYRAGAPPPLPTSAGDAGVTSEVTTIQQTGDVCGDLSPPFAPLLWIITETFDSSATVWAYRWGNNCVWCAVCRKPANVPSNHVAVLRKVGRVNTVIWGQHLRSLLATVHARMKGLLSAQHWCSYF